MVLGGFRSFLLLVTTRISAFTISSHFLHCVTSARKKEKVSFPGRR